jgi:hypothetical protein
MNPGKSIGVVPSAWIMELSEIGKARFGIAQATEKRTDLDEPLPSRSWCSERESDRVQS